MKIINGKMKAKMAEGSEYFGIGSIVSCKSCYDKQFEGEVLSFDPQTKMLILKCPATNGKPNLHDIHMINLRYVSEVDVKKEASHPPPVLQSLNLQKLTNREKQQLDEKTRLINAMAAGVSPEGQQLFLTITKTIEEVSWNGPNIVVMNQVTISPPYRSENCKGRTDSHALIHVRKIVEKFVKDQQVVAPEDCQQAQAATNSVPQQQTPQA